MADFNPNHNLNPVPPSKLFTKIETYLQGLYFPPKHDLTRGEQEHICLWADARRLWQKGLQVYASGALIPVHVLPYLAMEANAQEGQKS